MEKIGTFILVHCIVYLIGCFIAWDINPLDWWLFNTSIGRICFLVFEMFCIGNLLED